MDKENAGYMPAIARAKMLQGVSTECIEKFSTLSEETNRCHDCANMARGEEEDGCGRDACEAVQRDMKRSIRNRIPLQIAPFTKCGREGTVFYFSTTVVKVLPMNEREHESRCELWIAASEHGVGPATIEAQMWFTEFGFGITDLDETGWTGWSSVQTLRLEPVSGTYDEILRKTIELIRRTADAGLLHADPTMDNIMQLPDGSLVFVDWEDGLQFEPRTRALERQKKCPFCVIAFALMLHKLHTTLRMDSTENFPPAQRTELSRLAEAALEKTKNEHPSFAREFLKELRGRPDYVEFSRLLV